MLNSSTILRTKLHIASQTQDLAFHQRMMLAMRLAMALPVPPRHESISATFRTPSPILLGLAFQVLSILHLRFNQVKKRLDLDLPPRSARHQVIPNNTRRLGFLFSRSSMPFLQTLVLAILVQCQIPQLLTHMRTHATTIKLHL